MDQTPGHSGNQGHIGNQDNQQDNNGNHDNQQDNNGNHDNQPENNGNQGNIQGSVPDQIPHNAPQIVDFEPNSISRLQPQVMLIDIFRGGRSNNQQVDTEQVTPPPVSAQSSSNHDSGDMVGSGRNQDNLQDSQSDQTPQNFEPEIVDFDQMSISSLRPRLMLTDMLRETRRNDEDLVRRNDINQVNPQFSVPPSSNQVADTNDDGAVVHEASEPNDQEPATTAAVEANNEQVPKSLKQEPLNQNLASQVTVSPPSNQVSVLNIDPDVHEGSDPHDQESTEQNPASQDADDWEQFTSQPSKFPSDSSDDFFDEFPLLDSLPEAQDQDEGNNSVQPDEKPQDTMGVERPVAVQGDNPDQDFEEPVKKKPKLVENYPDQDCEEPDQDSQEPRLVAQENPIDVDSEGTAQEPQNQTQPDQVSQEPVEPQDQDSEGPQGSQEPVGQDQVTDEPEESVDQDSEEAVRKNLATLMCVARRQEDGTNRHYYY